MPRKPAPRVESPAKNPPERAIPPTTEAILAALNPPQREAVEHVDGPLLILAGAGSGKTRVLAHRVAHLVASGVPPYRIVAVTFTNKAAGEMRDRIAGLIGPEATREATIGTFHSICARILRREGDRIGLTSSFTIYDRADQLAVIKEAIRRLDLDDKRFAPSALLAFIGQRKDELADPATAKRQADNFWEETAAQVYEAYQRDLAESDAADFDDLLLRVVFLFEQHPEVLARYQRRWQYVLVDEYQDTNRAQYRLCALLAAVHHNLAVVGDDDQSIYSWRGADLRNILDFERDWPDAKVVKLEQNYRSTQTILDAAHAVVSRVEGRKDKRLWTDRGAGAAVQVFDAYNEYEEAEFVARQVERLASSADRRRGWASLLTTRAEDGPDDGTDDDGTDDEGGKADAPTAAAGASGPMRFGDIAVAYRVNAQSRVLEEAFMRFGIPYQLVGGVRFYERREVKDALAYARLARNPGDRVALERVINVPTRGIGDKTVSELRAWADARGGTLWGAVEAAESNANLATRARTSLAGFAELVRGLAAIAAAEPASSVLEASLERSGLRAVLEDGTEEGTERWANLVELRNHAAEFDEIARARGPCPLPRGSGARLGPGHPRGASRARDPDHAARGEGPRVSRCVHGRAGGGAAAVCPGPRRRARARGGAPPDVRRHDPGQGPAVPRPRPAPLGVGEWRRRGRALPLPRRPPRGPARGRRRPPRARPGWVGSATRPVPVPGASHADRARPGPAPRPGGAVAWTTSRAPRRAIWGRVRPGLEPLRPERLPDLSVPDRPALPDVDLGSGTFGHHGNGSADADANPTELAWRAGDKVRHRRFGDGIVVSSQWVSGDEEVTVAFAGQGVRRLLGSYAGLERL